MKYFLDRDNDGHWYMIATTDRESWQKWRELDTESDEFYARINDFDDERLGVSPSAVEFENPKINL